MIFDETALRKLNALTLSAERVRAGRLRGDRRSSKRGTSIEFADFRSYAPGDDLRRLDWNIYARLDRPFIRLFEEEEDLAVYTLLDGSRSMDWGEGDEHKFTYAVRLAAALGAIALSSGDAISFDRLAESAADRFGPVRGSQQLLRYLAFLETVRPAGTTALNRALLNFTLNRRRAGLVFLLSDLLDPAGFQAGLKQLLQRGHQVVVLHVLAPDEMDPRLAGDLKLIDAEFETAQEVSLDPGILDAYRRQLAGWMEEIRAFCRARDVAYVPAPTGVPWEQFVLNQLRREGVVR